MVQIVVLSLGVGLRASAALPIRHSSRLRHLPRVLLVEVDFLPAVQSQGELLRRERRPLQVQMNIADDLASGLIGTVTVEELDVDLATVPFALML